MGGAPGFRSGARRSAVAGGRSLRRSWRISSVCVRKLAFARDAVAGRFGASAAGSGSGAAANHLR